MRHAVALGQAAFMLKGVKHKRHQLDTCPLPAHQVVPESLEGDWEKFVGNEVDPDARIWFERSRIVKLRFR